MLTDPIADYLTRVRNALNADHPEVEIPSSRLKKEMTRILVEQGYVAATTSSRPRSASRSGSSSSTPRIAIRSSTG